MRIDDLIEKIDQETDFPIKKDHLIDQFGEIVLEEDTTSANSEIEYETFKQKIERTERPRARESPKEQAEKQKPSEDWDGQLYQSPDEVRKHVESGL